MKYHRWFEKFCCEASMKSPEAITFLTIPNQLYYRIRITDSVLIYVMSWIGYSNRICIYIHHQQTIIDFWVNTYPGHTAFRTFVNEILYGLLLIWWLILIFEYWDSVVRIFLLAILAILYHFSGKPSKRQREMFRLLLFLKYKEKTMFTFEVVILSHNDKKTDTAQNNYLT